MILKSDFKNLYDMPTQCNRLKYTRKFSSDEYQKLELGLSAQSMEEKWNIYFDEGHLYLHRSWTGHCIYSVKLIQTADGYKAEYALVNRNLDQYNAKDDSYDLLLLDFLISTLLFGEDKVFPTPSFIDDTSGVFQHSISGSGYKEVSIKQKPWWKFW